MSRLSKHDVCLLQLVAKRSFQVPLLNSRFFQESIKVNHTRVYSRILPEVCADVMTTGLPDAYKKLICIVQRVHFQVRVGVFNCQQILIKFSFVIFCGEMCNNFYQNATNIMCVSSTYWSFTLRKQNRQGVLIKSTNKIEIVLFELENVIDRNFFSAKLLICS